MNKYEKLTHDISTALKNTEYIETDGSMTDGGTANLDCTGVFLPRWVESKVVDAAKKAGAYAVKYDFFKRPFYAITVPTRHQGNRRSARAEALTKELEKMGYNTFTYMQSD